MNNLIFFLLDSGGAAFSGMYTSYNEEEMLEKLVVIKVPMNPITGEAKYLKDLNSLGKRKPKNQDTCAGDKKSSESNQNYLNCSIVPILIHMFTNLINFSLRDWRLTKDIE